MSWNTEEASRSGNACVGGHVRRLGSFMTRCTGLQIAEILREDGRRRAPGGVERGADDEPLDFEDDVHRALIDAGRVVRF